MNVTGGMAQIEIQAAGDHVNVLANNYLLYQDRGVNGSKIKLYDTPHSYTDKKPPVQPFIDWIKTKNIQSPFKELTEEQKINNAAYAMREKVFQTGIKPRNIYSKEIPQLLEDLQNELADFAVQQLVQNIDVKENSKRIIIS